MEDNTPSIIDFVFVVHNHQPVGNFDFVIEQTYRDSYEPFLAVLEKRPAIRVGMHYTGHLWEYLETNHPDFIERLEALIARNQIELIGGALYEAVIPVLPERDALAQLASYKNILEKRINGEVSGMWLAERVWEPAMPSTIQKSGHRYTFLDEAHFFATGIKSEDTWGYFICEDRGSEIKVFPIDKNLRYKIPFELAERTIEELDRRRNSGVKLITYGDDGEKFGGWPGTKKWVYEDGWLNSFLDALENCEWINMTLPREAESQHKSRGYVYLPCASYEEMGEWTLPADTQIELNRIKDELRNVGLSERVYPLLRGGFWRSFLAKYPEVRNLYRRMLRVSKKVQLLEENGFPKSGEARFALMRGQSNDAYWHGVFGGIYLPHLRFAVENNLINAENLCGKIHLKDDEDVYVLENAALRLQINPEVGGGIEALDVKTTGINLVNTMTRQWEAYHSRILEASMSNNGGHSSIHDRLEYKEENLMEKLVIDDHLRLSFLDRFIKKDFSLDDLQFNRNIERGDFLDTPYQAAVSANKITLSRTGSVCGKKLSIEKTIRLLKSETAFSVTYKLDCEDGSVKDKAFAPEININLMAPDAPDRYFIMEGNRFEGNNLGSRGDYSGRRCLSLVDEYLKIMVTLEAVPYPRWVWHPLETISLSEGGVERIYQGSAIYPIWNGVDIAGKSPKIKLSVETW